MRVFNTNDGLKKSRYLKVIPKKEVFEDRFKLPKAEIFYEGNTTVIKNFDKNI
jgi:translation initiation factor 2 beta subunit (eIF-2beta)/eIF-5